MSRETRLNQSFARSQSGVSAVQPFMARLTRNLEDATMLVVGDSTGNETTEWVYLTAQHLAGQFPAYTVTYQIWDDTAKAYASPITVQTGTGSNTLHVFNCSVAGWACSNVWQSFPDNIVAIQPHLTLISLGHNESSSGTYNGFRALIYGNYLALTQAITAACPQTALVTVLQNPTQTNTNQSLRASVYEQIAALRGHGLIDVHQVWIDANRPGGWYADSVHPNSTGEAIWAQIVRNHFVYAPGTSPLPRPASSFLEPAEQMLINGDFAFFNSSVPDSWTATGSTCSKDTTNKESSSGYAVRIQSAGASTALVSQFLTAAQLASVKGKFVTLTARIRNNAGAQVITHARVGLAIGGAQSVVTDTTPLPGTGAFMWQQATAFIPATANYVQVVIYADSSSTGTGDCTVDRVILARGSLPRDLSDAAGYSARFSTLWIPPDIQEFGTPGTFTWTKPASARVVYVACIGGGGGGGSGRRGAAGTVRCGGGGAGGAAWNVATFDAADISSTVTVTVGAGGLGGASVATDNTNGNAGGQGTASSFGSYLRAAAASTAAAGGTGANGVAGNGGIGMASGTQGGSASTSGGVGAQGGANSAGGGAGGGGAGGGVTAGDSASGGGAGSSAIAVTANSGAVGGVVDTSVPTAGNVAPAKGVPGPGAGGGAASITTAAQAGANARPRGGGGGGGGASLNDGGGGAGGPSGAGGLGGDGYVLIITSSGD